MSLACGTLNCEQEGVEKENESLNIYRQQDHGRKSIRPNIWPLKNKQRSCGSRKFLQRNRTSSCLNQLKAVVNGEIPSCVNYLNFLEM